MSQDNGFGIVLPHEEVESLWFGGLNLSPGAAPSMEALVKRWFLHDDKFDLTCRNYEPLVRRIIKLPFDEIVALGDTPEHSLTLILLLDQFTRNFSRGSPFPFTEVDPLSQKLAEHFVLSLGHDTKHPPYKQMFYYLPFQHAERLDYQELAVSKQAYTCWETRDGEWKDFHEMMSKGLNSAWKHYVIVAKFGRFPHRNEVLGRETTEEEKKFLDEGGDTFAPPKPKAS